MMDGMTQAWRLGWGWIIGLAILVIIIGLIIKGVYQKTNPKSIK